MGHAGRRAAERVFVLGHGWGAQFRGQKAGGWLGNQARELVFSRKGVRGWWNQRVGVETTPLRNEVGVDETLGKLFRCLWRTCEVTRTMTGATRCRRSTRQVIWSQGWFRGRQWRLRCCQKLKGAKLNGRVLWVGELIHAMSARIAAELQGEINSCWDCRVLVLGINWAGFF